ncbi:hypothetical protein ABMB67_002513 [Halalkalibacter oceani]
MLKKWWLWLLIVLFILINLLITSRSDDFENNENKPNLINGEISTH